MTCIVGITNGKRVWLGGDSAGIAGYVMHLRIEGKVWQLSEFVIGTSGSTRLGQILRDQLTLPAIDGDVLAYMTTRFVDSLRACLRPAGKLILIDGAESIEADLLVGVRGRLFKVDGAFAVIEEPESYAAIGSGAHEAKGALWCMFGGDTLDPPSMAEIAPQILERALLCSERFNTGVRGPFHFVSTAEE